MPPSLDWIMISIPIFTTLEEETTPISNGMLQLREIHHICSSNLDLPILIPIAILLSSISMSHPLGVLTLRIR
jgi:hypothetical protein